MVPFAVFYNNFDAMHCPRQPATSMLDECGIVFWYLYTLVSPSTATALVRLSSSLASFLHGLLAKKKLHVIHNGLGTGRLVPPARDMGVRVETYQLFHIPTTDLHVSRVLVHAIGELLGDAGAVVAPLLLVRALVLRRNIVLLSLGGRTATAAEETADCVADRGANGDTTTEKTYR